MFIEKIGIVSQGENIELRRKPVRLASLGPAVRADYGYRVHMSMMTFAWAPRSVESKIKKLPKADRRVARAALNHLLNCHDSDYSTFYDKHLEFLRRHGKDAEEKLRKRPLRFIEQEGCLDPTYLHEKHGSSI